MGGPGYSVQIDESLFRARRKSNKGRLKPGDLIPKESALDRLKARNMAKNNSGHRNYGKRVTGPWVFGLVVQKQSDLNEIQQLKIKNTANRKNSATQQIPDKDKRKLVYKDFRKLNTRINRIYNKINMRKYQSKILQKKNIMPNEVRMSVVEK